MRTQPHSLCPKGAAMSEVRIPDRVLTINYKTTERGVQVSVVLRYFVVNGEPMIVERAPSSLPARGEAE